MTLHYNILAYIIYTGITLYLIYQVGKLLHRNGRVFILQLFANNVPLTNTTNNILLTAYYLFNMGYAILQLHSWEYISNPEMLIAAIAGKTGILIGVLAVAHYCNMAVIYYLSRKQFSIHHKNIQL